MINRPLSALLALPMLLGAVDEAEAATWSCKARHVGMLPSGELPPPAVRVEAETLQAAIDQARASFGAARIGCSPTSQSVDAHVDEVTKMTTRASEPAAVDGPGTQASAFVTPGFNAAALNMQTEVTALYLGDFEHARLERTGVEFSVLLNTYIQTYFRRCGAYLPADKVELPKTECAREQYKTRNGVPEGLPTCIKFRAVPSGVFAAPDLYAAKMQVEDSFVPGMTGAIMQNMLGAAARIRDAAAAVGDDMDRLLQQNACDAAGIRRFEGNLVRFALNRPALRLPTGDTLEGARAKKSPEASPQEVFKDSDYSKLMDDLILDNSQSWMTNRYDRNSVRDVRVLGRDRRGRPAALYAYYSFKGANGRPGQNGVKLVFIDGLPSCLYFDDMPGTCRSAGRRIVTQYESGSYQR